MDFADPASLMELPDSASLGPLGPLLRQLSFGERETSYIDLRQQLEDSYRSLKHLSEEEDPSFTARWLMKQVRDLCHEIKDYLDQAVSLDIAASNLTGYNFEEGLKGFTARLKAVSERGTSIKGFNRVATPDVVTLHLPVRAAPMEDLVQLLAFGDEKAKQLRVVTLSGFAGAVNTTAARSLYVKYGGRFQCRAFVRASKNPDMRTLFASILSQIKAPPGDAFSDVNGLLRRINNHLQHRRYLVVIDDLWTTPEMNFIMGAFPAGYCHSRIITTTQTKDVALANYSYSQNTFEMTHLNAEQSGRNPTPEGMKEELDRIYSKLSPELKTCLLYLNMYAADSTIRKDELVKQWMAESFLLTEKWDLPSPRKKKKEKMHHIMNRAGDYFDELVSRELIQPLERNCNDEVMSCTVEHMVLDMIAKKSKEVNFITSVNNYSETTGPPDEARRLSVQFGSEVNAKIPQNIGLSKIRTFVFYGFYGCLPSLVECKLLQVLILHIWADRGDATLDLSGISELFLLRYVKITCNVTVILPNEIGKLKDLETLEVGARMVTVPSDITSLPGLLNLSLPSANLPDGVTDMTSICTLGCFDLSRNSEENMKKLLELVNLEDLHLTCSDADILQNKMDVLWCSIFLPHRSLRSVVLVPTESYTDDAGASRMISISCESFSRNNVSPGAASASTTESVLERLELSPRICIFSSIPKRLAELGRLRILKIAVRELSKQDMDILKGLPALAALSLYVWITPEDRDKFGEDGFPVLKYFKFTCATAPTLAFLKGSMPNVRRLKLRFNASGSTMWTNSLLDYASLKHLKALQEISVKIGADGGAHESVARSALESAFQKFPIPPVVNIRSVDRIFGADKPERAADSCSSMSLESTSYQRNSGNESWRRMDDVQRVKVMRILVYIIGHKNFKFIQREMEQMTIIIEGNKEDNQGAIKEKWVLQMQELVYDIEDFIHNISWLTIRSSLKDIVDRMKHLKGRINTLRNWQHAAQLSQIADNNGATSAPSGYQTPLCYTPEDDLVGIEGPKTELMGLLSQGDPQLRVICIEGCSGLGKSTLARAAYDEPRSSHEFERLAWVVVPSDCNTSGDLLNKIRQQLVAQEEINTTPGDIPLRDILLGQRYLLVIDQVQRAEMWHGIKDALPKWNNGSRIIVTTSIQSVANAVATTTGSTGSYLYKMRALGDFDSRRLFWKEFYGRDTEPTPLLADGSESILKKCDGLPLSLVTMARLFRQHHRTGRVERFGSYVRGAPEAFGEMNAALAQCYHGLPDNGHRSCLLSLSIYPQGHQINRKSLIRRWLAEGLVAGDGVRNGEQVAADCFNELIDRNLIKPVLVGHNSRVKRCRPHGIMHEFIVNKAISRNFVTLVRKDEIIPNKQDHLVRRLSVQDSTAEGGRVATEIGLSVIRSLIIFKSVLFDFQSCKLLRVLDLEGCKGIDDAVLDAVCQFLILKYLSLRGSDVRRIPRKIRRLQYLETLDLRETEVEKLPIEVIKLPWLAHLFGKFNLPRELKLGKKNSKLHKFLSERSRLQTLSGFVMDKSSGSESIILDARFLRKVKVWFKGYSTFLSQDQLVSSLNTRFTGSSALESLSIVLNDYAPGFLHCLEAPCMVRSVKFSAKLGKLPNFITSPETTLRELELSSTGLSSQELSLLQKLPCLLYLKLYEDRWGFGSDDFQVDSHGFLSLERLCFEAPTIPQLHIEEGAMSKLASLYLLCPEYPPSRVEGLQYLLHLNEVVLHDSLEDSELSDWNMTAMLLKNRPRVTKQAPSS